jgi:signal transduction histidine kinase
VELEERPSEAVETTAYFVIAEALANVTKHSGASAARVSVSRMGTTAGGRGRGNGEGTTDLLVAEVEDDGAGGANPAGAGLAGLSDRVVALDGHLEVESPAGGPTRVRAELPWGVRGG